MTSKAQSLSVVWLKRDLRLEDHEPIYSAIKSGKKILLLFVLEEGLWTDQHYSERHLNFVKESIQEINRQLISFNTKVLVIKGEVISIFQKLSKNLPFHELHSYQETGIQLTYLRDQQVAIFCKENNIIWHEHQSGGVWRGRRNRNLWKEEWTEYMSSAVFSFAPPNDCFLSLTEIQEIEKAYENIIEITFPKNTKFQKGGISKATTQLDHFLKYGHYNYQKNISKPQDSRESCSRLSPYLAWGNLSVRQVWQQTQLMKRETRDHRNLNAFTSRLRWQAHFIQKFEMECRMEFESLNRGFHSLVKTKDFDLIKAWEDGKTGFPLVDAAMRCLITTGYVNFRMRALLVSFFTHHLWQPWQACAHHLARNFLDFEPGIHYPQIQMQAGETGINAIRIYNPVKNSLTYDSEAIFLKKWLPELASLPLPFIHQPWLLTPMEEKLYSFRYGLAYPKRIINMDISRKHASEQLYIMQKHPYVISENKHILERHTLADRNNFD